MAVVSEDRTQTYGQYCPVSRALELLGERWALLIVRDLLCGTTRFNDLARGLPGLSRTLLAKRLRQLARAGLVDHLAGEYVLTPAGRELEPIVFGLGGWGARWAFSDPTPEELDPQLLVWWMHDRIDTSAIPGNRHVIAVIFTDEARSFWIVIDRGTASVCESDPGYPVDLTVRGALSDLYRVWLGRVPVDRAVRREVIRVEGDRAWTSRLSTILQRSPIAPLVPAEADPA
ncbi:winged helix-turn-helix transcriptional regulator [Granulicoccus phenolivorans]|uniref:winged helix-turn-helix transcriptional regulator n=1 Tax=Granulicoccus phenolivorans TaxID=266854 RepID=UPI0004279AA0|nr:winged helix-turn-helix transcriptional regulator [Granulicoccus phenolivorans]